MTDPNVASRAIALAANQVGKSVNGPEGHLTILERVNLALYEGEVSAVVGPSGAGKSTLLSILAGLDLPTEGEVSLRGQSFAGLDEDARAALRKGQVGFVFQSFQLLPGLSALENVMLPMAITASKDARDRAEHWLSAVGLSARMQHTPTQLSGGEQQRVALARAFVAEPALIFADEPTGNLDSDTSEQIVDLMFQMRAQQNTTLLLVTHDGQLAARCDKQYLLRDKGLELKP